MAAIVMVQYEGSGMTDHDAREAPLREMRDACRQRGCDLYWQFNVRWLRHEFFHGDPALPEWGMQLMLPDISIEVVRAWVDDLHRNADSNPPLRVIADSEA